MLLCVIATGVLNEIISMTLLSHDLPIRLNTTIYIIIHNFLWLMILYHISAKRNAVIVAISLLSAFTIYSLALLDGFHRFNSYTMVVGALLYVATFVYDSSIELRRENLRYFLSNDYLLILSPVIFFISFSLLFGFRSIELRQLTIGGRLTLFDFISYFANITYFTLINLYIYREKTLAKC